MPYSFLGNAADHHIRNTVIIMQNFTAGIDPDNFSAPVAHAEVHIVRVLLTVPYCTNFPNHGMPVSRINHVQNLLKFDHYTVAVCAIERKLKVFADVTENLNFRVLNIEHIQVVVGRLIDCFQITLHGGEIFDFI